MRSNLLVMACAVVAWLAGCAAPATGSGDQSNRSVAGRWAGNYMLANGAGGGSARLVIDADGRVRGSLREGAAAAGSGTPRVGTVQGTERGGTLALSVQWVGGSSANYQGTVNAQAPGSLGVNLRPAAGGADAMVLALHAQGMSGLPPYGQPPKGPAPDFQRAWVGTWVVNWYDGGPDYGSGNVRIAADGSMDGQLVDDAFNSAEWNQPVGATLKGHIAADGSIDAGLAWSTGRAGWSVTGKAYFTGPESFQVQFSPAGGDASAGKSVTMTFHRGQ
jgi:hypothetical protein